MLVYLIFYCLLFVYCEVQFKKITIEIKKNFPLMYWFRTIKELFSILHVSWFIRLSILPSEFYPSILSKIVVEAYFNFIEFSSSINSLAIDYDVDSIIKSIIDWILCLYLCFLCFIFVVDSVDLRMNFAGLTYLF